MPDPGEDSVTRRISFFSTRNAVVPGIVAMACLSSVSAFGQCGSLAAPSDTAVASGGNWSTPGTWVTNTGATVVPNSTFNTCIVNGTLASPATVTLTGGGLVLNLQVGANNTLSASSNLGVYGSQIINNGAMN